MLFGSKCITYKKEKTGCVACNQPGGTNLLDRLLRVDARGVCLSVASGKSHSTAELGEISADSRDGRS